MLIALRAAVAAILAWLIVIPLGGVADSYPYYAPLGATVAVSTTVLSSIRTSAQVFTGLLAGALIGLGAQALPGPGFVAVGSAIGVGAAVALLPWFGAMASWVPISALFVLILDDGSMQFVTAYLGLTSLGALVGTALNLAFPPLMFAQTRRAQETLRSALAEELDALAAVLAEQDPQEVGPSDLSRTERRASEVERMVSEAFEGPQVNWRMWRWQHHGEELRTRASALGYLALVVHEAADVVSSSGLDRQDSVWREELRGPAAEALTCLADLLRDSNGVDVPRDDWEEARDCVHRLAEAVRRVRHDSGDDLFAAGALVDGLRRSLWTMRPDGEPGRDASTSA